MQVVLQLRGSNTATVKDIVDLRKTIRDSAWRGHMYLVRVEDQLKTCLDLLI